MGGVWLTVALAVVISLPLAVAGSALLARLVDDEPRIIDQLRSFLAPLPGDEEDMP